MLTVVYRIASDEEVARDYAEEAWVRTIRALPSFRGEARFSTWLHRVAVNTALQAMEREERREKRERPIPESLAEPVGSRDVLLERSLEEALSKVPGRMREVLILHDVEGHTHEQIGELLGITIGTSKSQLFKARARMRELLSPNGFGEYMIEQREGVEA